MSILLIKRISAFKAAVVLVAAVAALLMLAAFARPAPAVATFTVDTTADDDDVTTTPVGGTCKGGVDDDCTLRRAIARANTTPGNDTIVVPADTYTLTRIGPNEDATATGDLDLTDADGVEIQGAGAGGTIIEDARGADRDRIFEVAAGTTASISGVTARLGDLGTDGPNGGGILNSGTLTLNDSTVSANTASAGGGVANVGTLTLNDSTVSANLAVEDGGGILNSGTLTLNDSTVSGRPDASSYRTSGIFNSGTTMLNDSTVSDNVGAGVHNESGAATLNDSTVSGNLGGGLYNYFTGTLTLKNSTVNANVGVGGIYSQTNTNLSSASKTTVTNSTISGNTADGRGGGIYNSSGLTVIEHSTITNNTAPSGKGSGVYSGGDTANTRTEVFSTIVSGNTNTDVDTGANTFKSKGFNLIGDGNATAAFNEPEDRINVADPGLRLLLDNGGPTQTHALFADSPAIDAGTNSGCPATDQRGETRPQGPRCDIGAFERENSPPAARNDIYKAREDTTLARPAPGVLANDTDPDGDPLTATVVSRPKKGKLSLKPSGAFTYKPAKNFNGADRFVYEARDGKGGADRATVTIRVRPVRG